MKKVFSKIWTFYKKTLATIGKFNTRVILTLVYFTVLPVFKIFKLGQTINFKRTTSWQDRNTDQDKAYEHQF